MLKPVNDANKINNMEREIEVWKLSIMKLFVGELSRISNNCYGYQMSILRWNNAKQKKKILLQGENTMKNVLKNHCEVENYVILHGLWNSAIDCIWEKARNLGNSGLRTKVCPQIGLFFSPWTHKVCFFLSQSAVLLVLSFVVFCQVPSMK